MIYLLVPILISRYIIFDLKSSWAQLKMLSLIFDSSTQVHDHLSLIGYQVSELWTIIYGINIILLCTVHETYCQGYWIRYFIFGSKLCKNMFIWQAQAKIRAEWTHFQDFWLKIKPQKICWAAQLELIQWKIQFTYSEIQSATLNYGVSWVSSYRDDLRPF